MKHPQAQSLGKCRLVRCVLVIALLLVPYLLDVAYYWDFTPTHYAQEKFTSDNETYSFHDNVSSFLGYDQENFSGEVGLARHDAPREFTSPSRVILSPQNPFIASLTSRPPPAR